MPKYRNSLNVDPNDNDPLVTRRSFLALMGVGACLVLVLYLMPLYWDFFIPMR
jgi:hypothetical protein